MLPRYRVNGAERGAVTPADRGLQYGDGLFETIAVRDGRPLRIARHLARLDDGCRRLGITPPPALDEEARDFCDGIPAAVLKLIVTRGVGGRGYGPTADAQPTRILALHPWPDHPRVWSDDGVAVRWCATTLAHQPALAGLKHLNRLEQVLARAEWDDTDAWQEGLVCDDDGHVIEATQANLFVVRDGCLLTPELATCGVAGIVRAMLVEAAEALGIACTERRLDRDEVERADEALLCNSVIGIWPVRRIGSRGLAVPGPVTERLQRWFAEHGDA